MMRGDFDRIIPISQFNDNYCDCFYTGLDEPGTSACSKSKFYCDQPLVEPEWVPGSFVDDGVCDCCDGSDEAQGTCFNVCD